MDGMNEKELQRFEALIRQNENLRQQIEALKAIITNLLKDSK
ncbi:MAG: hypothetical protein ACI4J3_07840 [Oscillospiraceae bacterium]